MLLWFFENDETKRKDISLKCFSIFERALPGFKVPRLRPLVLLVSDTSSTTYLTRNGSKWTPRWEPGDYLLEIWHGGFKEEN